MNPDVDVPSLEACRRLAKAGYPQNENAAFWFWSPDEETGEMELCTLVGPRDDEVAAPTIGEMLAEIRRRGWRMVVGRERKSDGGLEFTACLLGRGHAVHEREADARALALAVAIRCARG